MLRAMQLLHGRKGSHGSGSRQMYAVVAAANAQNVLAHSQWYSCAFAKEMFSFHTGAMCTWDTLGQEAATREPSKHPLHPMHVAIGKEHLVAHTVWYMCRIEACLRYSFMALPDALDVPLETNHIIPLQSCEYIWSCKAVTLVGGLTPSMHANWSTVQSKNLGCRQMLDCYREM